MKFGILFEFHKIPEWYENYLHYNMMTQEIENHKDLVNKQIINKLGGIYFLTE